MARKKRREKNIIEPKIWTKRKKILYLKLFILKEKEKKIGKRDSKYLQIPIM